ncbi:hypothetical protein J2W36_005213 [Variovorax ginsengisoli]|uniref:Uncharacterized protein n=1 Tax=Variovorax ginsengisoli TaxID=363844 RepID=A0ABT9SHR3_9BURK|nr:hypothetical protein [Variovorax ginsengisoli]
MVVDKVVHRVDRLVVALQASDVRNANCFFRRRVAEFGLKSQLKIDRVLKFSKIRLGAFRINNSTTGRCLLATCGGSLLSGGVLARTTNNNIFTRRIGPSKRSALIAVRKQVLLAIKRAILRAFNQRFIFRLFFRHFTNSQANVSRRIANGYGAPSLNPFA